MKNFIAAIAASVALIAIAAPASAGYTSPNSSKVQQALQNGVP